MEIPLIASGLMMPRQWLKKTVAIGLDLAPTMSRGNRLGGGALSKASAKAVAWGIASAHLS
jgi:hypothetical protein